MSRNELDTSVDKAKALEAAARIIREAMAKAEFISSSGRYTQEEWDDAARNYTNDMVAAMDHTPVVKECLTAPVEVDEAWRPMSEAPTDARILIDFMGAGPIVACRDPDRPDHWIRYLGFGKSSSWPGVHDDFALGWLPVSAAPSIPKGE